MPIPDLDSDGFLPEGIHDCSLDEIGARFGRFQVSDQRCRLFQKLREYISEARKIGLIAEFIVDGSFVTDKPEPNDIDLVIVLVPSRVLEADLPPYQYNLISKRMVRRIYAFDVLVALSGTKLHGDYIDLFQQVRGQPDRRKGILRVIP
jgi:hypothetical protein